MIEVYKEMSIQIITHRDTNGVKSEYHITIPSTPGIIMKFKCNTIFEKDDEALEYGLSQAKKRIDHMNFQSEEHAISKLF